MAVLVNITVVGGHVEYEGGTVYGSGTVSVDEGASVQFSYVPDQDHRFVQWNFSGTGPATFDGKRVGSSTTAQSATFDTAGSSSSDTYGLYVFGEWSPRESTVTADVKTGSGKVDGAGTYIAPSKGFSDVRITAVPDAANIFFKFVIRGLHPEDPDDKIVVKGPGANPYDFELRPGLDVRVSCYFAEVTGELLYDVESGALMCGGRTRPTSGQLLYKG